MAVRKRFINHEFMSHQKSLGMSTICRLIVRKLDTVQTYVSKTLAYPPITGGLLAVDLPQLLDNFAVRTVAPNRVLAQPSNRTLSNLLSTGTYQKEQEELWRFLTLGGQSNIGSRC